MRIIIMITITRMSIIITNTMISSTIMAVTSTETPIATGMSNPRQAC